MIENKFKIHMGDPCYLFRCPHCSFEDNKVKNSKITENPIEFNCFSCGKIFLIRIDEEGNLETCKELYFFD